MPLVKIDIEKGQSREFLLSLMDLTMNCVKEGLKLPQDDTNIRLTEFEPGFFRMKTPYRIIIEISMFAGRSVEAKRNLYQLITNTLFEKLAVEKTHVFILINDQPKENWGVRGGVAACDLELGFKVDI